MRLKVFFSFVITQESSTLTACCDFSPWPTLFLSFSKCLYPFGNTFKALELVNLNQHSTCCTDLINPHLSYIHSSVYFASWPSVEEVISRHSVLQQHAEVFEDRAVHPVNKSSKMAVNCQK